MSDEKLKVIIKPDPYKVLFKPVDPNAPCELCDSRGMIYKRKITDRTAYAFRCSCHWGRRKSQAIPFWDDVIKEAYF